MWSSSKIGPYCKYCFIYTCHSSRNLNRLLSTSVARQNIKDPSNLQQAQAPESQLPRPSTEKKKAPGIISSFISETKKNEEEAKIRESQVGSYLVRPIGMISAPKASDNTGLDTRTFAQKRADFVDYDRHIEKRKGLMEEFSKSYFSEMRDFTKTMGKEWVAPRMYFRADKALYMPNFFGPTLLSSKPSDTTSVLRGKVSVVKLYSSVSGEQQVNSYFKSPAYAAGTHLTGDEDYQIIDINVPESFVKRWVSKLFAGRTRAALPQHRYAKFFYASMLPHKLNRSIGFVNKFSGYVYIVDRECRIRWAACGKAEPEERESFVQCLNGVLAEHQAHMRHLAAHGDH
ncbi:ATP10 protein-domain-containing protein [Lipomyces oligophaga]|uniref:ATP10 protein-domain-containing protein n=1 Tax=Lipomyces oligophaga TaxID=45792 RepID=UPI0034CF9AF7